MLDRVPPTRRHRPAPPPPGSFAVDLTDYGQTLDAMLGVEERTTARRGGAPRRDPGAGPAPNAATFDNNITATYNVFAAARAAGITTSSGRPARRCSACRSTTPPPYLPVDEEYPPGPSHVLAGQDLEEEMAPQFCRWNPG